MLVVIVAFLSCEGGNAFATDIAFVCLSK